MHADYGNGRTAYCSETLYKYSFASNVCTKTVYYWETLDEYEEYKNDDSTSYIYLLKTTSGWMVNEWVESNYETIDKNGSYLGKPKLCISTTKDCCLLNNDFSDGSYGFTISGTDVPGWITYIKIISNGENGPVYSNPYYYIETITDTNDRIYSERRFIQYGEDTDKTLIYNFSLTSRGYYNGSSTIPTEHEITEYVLDETTHAQTSRTVEHYENGTLTSTTYTYSPDGDRWVVAP